MKNYPGPGGNTPDLSKPTLLRTGVAALLTALPAISGNALPLLQYFLPAAIASLLTDCNRAYMIVAVALTTGIILSGISGHYNNTSLIVQNGGLAMMIIYAEKERYSGPFITLTGTIFLVFVVIASITLLLGMDISGAIKAITTEVLNSFDKSLEEYKAAGNAVLPPDAENLFEHMKRTVAAFFPGIVGCSLAGAAFSNVMLSRYWIKRHSGKDLLGPDFAEWRFPDWLIWFFIVSAACTVSGYEGIESAGRNALLVTCLFYLIQGISLIQYCFEVIKCPVYIRWFTWLILGLQWYGLIIITAIGVSIIWIDIRGFIDRRFGGEGQGKERH